jgi:hypothetical protein
MIKTNTLSVIGSAATILLATAGSAVADLVYSIDAALTTPAGSQFVIGSDIAPPPPPTPYESSRTVNTGITGAAVTVGYGVIGAQGFFGSSSNAAALAPGAEISGQAMASLGVALDNLTISDPSLPAGTQIFYEINFGISGNIALVASGAADADASVSLSYNSVALGSAQDDTIEGSSASGIFSHGLSGVIAHTPLESGVVGGPVNADFTLVTSAFVSAGPSAFGVTTGQASANSDFQDPFSFPSDGPIFNFFDANGNSLIGATVNSSDGCIVNNRLLCGGPSSVPELSTWAMMVAGFAGLGLAGWRRGRRRPVVPIGEEFGYD